MARASTGVGARFSIALHRVRTLRCLCAKRPHGDTAQPPILESAHERLAVNPAAEERQFLQRAAATWAFAVAINERSRA